MVVTRVTRTLLCLGACAVLASCSDAESSGGVSVDIAVFHPQAEGIADFGNLSEVRVVAVQRSSRDVLADMSYSVESGSGDLPEIPFGRDLQIVVEGEDAAGIPIVRGQSVPFNLLPGDDGPSLGVLTSSIGSFHNAATLFEENDGSRDVLQVNFHFAEGRAGTSMTRLRDGRVVVLGGATLTPDGQKTDGVPDDLGIATVLDRAEIYNPSAGTFAPLPAMQFPRAYHTATLLDDGRILVAGGVGLFDGDLETVRPAEILNVSSGRWEEVSTTLGPTTGRAWHTATVRKRDGDVVLAGGRQLTDGDSTVLGTVEIFDISEGAFRTNPGDVDIALPEPRAEHQAVLLANGRGQGADVLLIGGVNADGEPQGATWIVTNSNDPNRYEVASPDDLALATPRTGHTAHRITPGSGTLIAVVGGQDANGDALGGIEIIDTSSFSVSSGGRMEDARHHHTVVELPFTRRLVAIGGADGDQFVGSAEVLNFDETSGRYTAQPARGSMVHARMLHGATLLNNGLILIAGGVGGGNGGPESLDAVELFNADDGSPASDEDDGFLE